MAIPPTEAVMLHAYRSWCVNPIIMSHRRTAAIAVTVAGATQSIHHIRLPSKTKTTVLRECNEPVARSLLTRVRPAQVSVNIYLNRAQWGVPGVEFNSWYGLLAKAGPPIHVQQK